MSDTTPGTTPTTPNKRSGFLFSEALVRQFLAAKFYEISQTIDDPNVTFIEELFHKAGDDIVLQIKTWWRENTNIEVSINFPRTDTSMPFVAVVNAGEREKDAETVLGDYGGRAYYGTRNVEVLGGVQRAEYTRDLLTVPHQHTISIYVAAEDPNVVTYLYYVVMALLLANKVDFDRYGGMRNLSIAGSDLQHHPELFPEFAFFKVVTLTFDTQFDVPLQPKRTIGGISLSLSAFLYGSDDSDVVK